MARSTKSITFSVPADMAVRVEEVMRQQGRSRSDLLREALLRYIEECEWRRLLDYGEQQARGLGLKPSKWPPWWKSTGPKPVPPEHKGRS